MSNPIVKRPRKKVVKACLNCRRRKIKCTGTFPCSNCAAYQCECVFDETKDIINNNNSNNNNARTNNSNENRITELVSPKPKTKRIKKERKNTKTVTTTLPNSQFVMEPLSEFRVSSPPPSHPSNMSLLNDTKSTLFNGPSQVISNESQNNIVSPNPVNQDIVNVNNSNNQMEPHFESEDELSLLDEMSLNKKEDGPYEDDHEATMKLRSLKDTITQLKSIPNPNATILKMIKDMKKQIHEYINEWEPIIDLNKLPQSTKLGINDGSKSVETYLMKNKYRNEVNLTCFSVWKASQLDSTAPEDEPEIFSKLPLIDDVFGLNSPLQPLSLRGIGCLLQRRLIRKSSPSVLEYLKPTVYIMLRFFDVVCIQLNDDYVSIANPLEDFLEKADNPMGSPTGTVSSSTFSATGPKNASNKELVAILINKLPQPFTENLTSISSQQLIITANDDDIKMFGLVVSIYNTHRLAFDDFMLNMTSDSNLEDKSKYVEDYTHLIEMDNILLPICYAYYNATLYHLDDYNSLEYLDVLLSFLEHQAWLDEYYGLEKFLNVAVNCANKMGLFRWEYYVGFDEVTAERRRRLWWRLYNLEKFYSLKTGELSLIDDEKMNCLLFKEFRDVGFTDHKDFLSRVNSIPRNSIFDNMTIASLKSYGESACLQVTSNFFAKVLYSERYTNIRNNAKPLFLRNILLNEVMDALDAVADKFQHIKEHTLKLFKIAQNTQHVVSQELTKQELLQATDYVLFHEHIFCSIVSSAYNVITRLSDWPRPKGITARLKTYGIKLYHSWVHMGELIQKLDNDYMVRKSLSSYILVFVLVITKTFINSNFFTLQDISLTLKIFKRVENLFNFVEIDCKDKVHFSQILKAFSRAFSLLLTLTRILVLDFMDVHNVSAEELTNLIKTTFVPDDGISDMVNIILDYKSQIYKYLLEPVQKSGFHLNIKQMLDACAPSFNQDDTSHNLNAVSANNHSCRQSIKLYPPTILRPISPSKVSQPGEHEPLPPITSLTDVNGLSLTPNQKGSGNLNSPSQQQLSDQTPFNSRQSREMLLEQAMSKDASSDLTSQLPLTFTANGNENNISKSYNLGTLEEFVMNTDLNDLYSVLWNDEVPESYMD
ncbi:Zn(II)2Cys6 transcription factor NDAI_0A03420 [Naumovozyma dairenensis CBS 421]|uniref:Zn(2)-C6 fungal-type domain-containing protein n=1 Tax=Naumovozyma dairenensis (strain ATCC 10597 / BCRC 20456 / CBS 421 / NBRC 0211 / NRRL Y-12639) TaxID=1071378 RepID=G0W3W1_NAUDC|nr:hypothetical protein NDAI_0A03420 [Naumovozyma dairenensis CBS 421]CCD22499.1 hypothetical protein NDAI_0A03420 [Naumovozyma dairenensis CBS 421]